MNAPGGRTGDAGMAAALQAFRRAQAGELTPAGLALELRAILAGADENEPWSALREFVELDLADFAYSLAIHDQPALDNLKARIHEWIERLEKETGAG